MSPLVRRFVLLNLLVWAGVALDIVGLVVILKGSFGVGVALVLVGGLICLGAGVPMSLIRSRVLAERRSR